MRAELSEKSKTFRRFRKLRANRAIGMGRQMEQLEGILVFSTIAIVVPVVVARFVVRSDWRMIRNACLIWYGFLLLSSGAMASADGFGWALILAMYFSILAIPLLALAFRLWDWLMRR